jgi:hypothetical protein
MVAPDYYHPASVTDLLLSACRLLWNQGPYSEHYVMLQESPANCDWTRATSATSATSANLAVDRLTAVVNEATAQATHVNYLDTNKCFQWYHGTLKYFFRNKNYF